MRPQLTAAGAPRGVGGRACAYCSPSSQSLSGMASETTRGSVRPTGFSGCGLRVAVFAPVFGRRGSAGRRERAIVLARRPRPGRASTGRRRASPRGTRGCNRQSGLYRRSSAAPRGGAGTGPSPFQTHVDRRPPHDAVAAADAAQKTSTSVIVSLARKDVGDCAALRGGRCRAVAVCDALPVASAAVARLPRVTFRSEQQCP